MFVSAPKSCKINNLSNSEPQIKKWYNLHFDSHFVSCSYGDEFRGHFGFCFQIYLSVTFIYGPVTFIHNPLSHYNYDLVWSIYLAVAYSNTEYIKTAHVLDLKVK